MKKKRVKGIVKSIVKFFGFIDILIVTPLSLNLTV